MSKAYTAITLAFGLAIGAVPANAATTLTSATVSGLTSGAMWNTAVDPAWTLFLRSSATGPILNPDDIFAGSPVTATNNYSLFGEGFRPGAMENSDLTYRLSLGFSDGATLVGDYVGSTFTPSAGSTSTVAGTTYTLTGFGYDRQGADVVSRFSAVSGGDAFDYTGLFAFTATPTAAVPEPATWAMMLFGFGAIGFGMRRREKVQRRVRFAL